MKDPLPPFSDARLADPRYRADLLSKLTALISVLEVARAKVVVRLSAGTPAAHAEEDLARLRRMRRQVENTLQICRRAQLELRSGDAITAEEVLGTDIDELCEQLASDLDVQGGDRPAAGA